MLHTFSRTLHTTYSIQANYQTDFGYGTTFWHSKG